MLDEALIDELCEQVCERIHGANANYWGLSLDGYLDPRFDHLSAIFEFLKPGRHGSSKLSLRDTKIGPALMVAEVSAAILKDSGKASDEQNFEEAPSPAFLRPDQPNAPIGLDGRTTLACLIFFLSSLSRLPNTELTPKTNADENTITVEVQAKMDNFKDVKHLLSRCVNGVELKQSKAKKTVTLTLPRMKQDDET